MKVISTETAAAVALGTEIPATDLVVALAEQVLIVLLETVSDDAVTFIDCLTTFLGFEAFL